jgi:hypothetical protein
MAVNGEVILFPRHRTKRFVARDSQPKQTPSKLYPEGAFEVVIRMAPTVA